ncbi:putative pre-mRNA-splicing factor ATP-dependent RNA helicase DHX32 isoform X2 [Ornithorhynchus anatinus]|uniref:DEAH-box helicase 32 (putative) n=4 Tax=Ornithorhynchus anatinus TaxID=9258 RepID=A0A6I8N0T0_ORNAN|nr:putative pre-mRNA-splicing factor ATP-dependent RNA helicase DHX32 isoform X2 [Ornithorhynchus anatinus]XP_028915779.1 putative pre-mRNA-splicing factor ATP-dependent RNA helicase DHX32 isoform X2 [Ornithorhynchus anatinus]XP_028915780.1 putative pre-mRNA-splicing factor ATP-dependent RNA helicase DHX32 isoform X2 [Ornithorhynchus anatinus]
MDGPAALPDSSGSSDGEGDGGDGAAPDRDGLELNPFDGLPFSSRYYKLLKERAALPVWKEKYSFLETLLRDQVVIVSGEGRCGKSSQIPQWCAEFCLSERPEAGSVVCAQVHRQAAVALALRVADEMDVSLGQEVGYAVPFENCCSSETILRYCTAEVLQREMRSLPLLSRYAVVVLDDVHHRSAATDVLLGPLRGVLRARPRLRLVLVLADSPPLLAELRAFYGPAPVLEVGARRTPARVTYRGDALGDPFGSAVRLLFDIHRTGESGDVVVFLACEQEIRRAYELICEEGSRLGPEAGELVAVPLYPREKYKMLRPNDEPEEGSRAPRRRVVLTTSSGEALIGPDAFRFVIDVGLERRKVYNPWIRASAWTTRPISEGRARERRCIPAAPAGQVFCLYSEEWRRRHVQPLAPVQLQECNLTGTVLFLKRMDIAGLGHCDLITKPAPASLMQALEDLDYLAALDDEGNLSEFGIIMSEFPLEPQLAKAVLASCEFDCLSEMLTVAAMVTAPPCFSHPPRGQEEAAWASRHRFVHPEGDHFTLVNIFNAFQEAGEGPRGRGRVEQWCRDRFLDCGALRAAAALRAELVEIAKRVELPWSPPAFGSRENAVNLKKALLSGFFMQTARDVDGAGNYLTLTHRLVAQLHPLSGYRRRRRMPEWVLFHEFRLAERNYIRVVSAVTPELFVQLTPQYYFSNLPPSESKDLLLQASGRSAAPATPERDPDPGAAAPAGPRCSVQ